ncbi:peptidase inhibitor family I36 protein [Streptomyces sp. NPDC088354]|uniref:peptidase inhibitor family I36 protein n=1 Tax=Streptomyces sp. NPDC088354 TaxID=3365856 RepID=UPI00382E1397
MRTTFKWTLSTIIAVMAMIALSLGLSTQASASSSFGTGTGNGSTSACASWTMCIFSDNGYKGSVLKQFGDDSYSLSGTEYSRFNDKTSALINNSYSYYCFFENLFSGLTFQINPRTTVPSVNSWINDRITSWLVGTC